MIKAKLHIQCMYEGGEMGGATWPTPGRTRSPARSQQPRPQQRSPARSARGRSPSRRLSRSATKHMRSPSRSARTQVSPRGRVGLGTELAAAMDIDHTAISWAARSVVGGLGERAFPAAPCKIHAVYSRSISQGDARGRPRGAPIRAPLAQRSGEPTASHPCLEYT